jgi:hypothetical protein
MSFNAHTFIFNEIPSEFFNAYLGEPNGTGEQYVAAGNDVSLLTQKLYRKPVPLFYGAERTPVLSFPLSVYFPGYITEIEYSSVGAWLFDQNNYRVLQMCQSDMQDIYFNAFLTAPQKIKFGNMVAGVTFTVVCDAPWGWRGTEVKTDIITYSGAGINEYLTILNPSSDNYYTYPTMNLSSNIFGGTATITNFSDASRQFSYNFLPQELIIINGNAQTITSSKHAYPLAYFNKKWLRLVRGKNELLVSGPIEAIYMHFSIAIKV